MGVGQACHFTTIASSYTMSGQPEGLMSSGGRSGGGGRGFPVVLSKAPEFFALIGL